MAAPLYDDGICTVSRAVVATPSRFYPLANTTASIRRDPLWAGIALALLGAAGLAVYGDLLSAGECLGTVLTCAGGLLAGRETCILRLDAVGHPRALIVGRRGRILRLYRAIRDARTLDDAGHPETATDPENRT